MKRFAVVFGSAALFCTASAQSPGAAELASGTPAIIKLPAPSYPPIALAAMVTGRVELSVTVRVDGTVAAAEVESGPAMLRAPATESAKEMQFDCTACPSPETHFHVVFKYELTRPFYCDPPDRSYPRVSDDGDIVTFTGQPAGTCDPAATRVRSVKCVYLWKCSWR